MGLLLSPIVAGLLWKPSTEKGGSEDAPESLIKAGTFVADYQIRERQGTVVGRCVVRARDIHTRTMLRRTHSSESAE